MDRDEPRNIRSQYNGPLLLVIVFLVILLFLVL